LKATLKYRNYNNHNNHNKHNDNHNNNDNQDNQDCYFEVSNFFFKKFSRWKILYIQEFHIHEAEKMFRTMF